MHDLVMRYALRRDLRSASVEQLQYAMETFGRFLTREPSLADFTDDVVNRFLCWLPTCGYAHDTIKTRRRSLLTLWRSAADDGLTVAPRKVRPLAPVYVLPRAWTPSQVALILGECDQLRGTFRSCPTVERRLFARAFVLTAYETGFRRGDVLRIRRAMIEPSGLIPLVQSKTGRVHVSRVRPETIAAIDRMGVAGRQTVFGGIISLRRLSRLLKGIFRAACPEGSIKWLRRSGATHVEMDRPGTGWQYLGHTSARVAHQSYLDPLQTGAKPAIPPPLPD